MIQTSRIFWAFTMTQFSIDSDMYGWDFALSRQIRQTSDFVGKKDKDG